MLDAANLIGHGNIHCDGGSAYTASAYGKMAFVLN